MKKTIIIQDPNFFNRLVNLEIVSPNSSRQVSISLLRKVKEIDLSAARINCADELSYFEKLQKVNLKFNKIKNLDLSHNVNLRSVDLSGNQIDSLKLGELNKLHFLDVGGNRLKSLELPDNNSLFELSIYGNKLKKIDLSKSKDLRVVNISSNLLKELDVKAQRLFYLNCAKNKLTYLDLNNQSNLEYLNAEENKLLKCNMPSHGVLSYALLNYNNINLDHFKTDEKYSSLQFEYTGSLRLNNFEDYLNLQLHSLSDDLRKCLKDGESYVFCFDMIVYVLRVMLNKYDRKRRLHRYQKGLVILALPIILCLDILSKLIDPTYSESDFDYEENKRVFYQEATSLDIDEFPWNLKLLIKGKEVLFEAEEVAITSKKEFNRIIDVRYSEIIIGKIRAHRSVIIWND